MRRLGLAVALVAASASVQLAHQESDPAAARWKTLERRAGALYKDRKFDEALAAAQEALVEADGLSEPYLSRSLDQVGRVLLALGRAADAAAVFERALRIQESTLPPSLAALADSLDKVARAYVAAGRAAQAGPLYSRCLQLSARALSVNDADYSRYFLDYGAMLRDTGEPQKAKHMDMRAEKIRTSAYYRAQMAYRKQDYATALTLFREAADHGDAFAIIAIGDMYRHGEGAPEDMNEAIRWYREGARQSSTIAQVKLGSMYENGNGVDRDLPQAVHWYREAAELGDPAGAQYLGDMYSKGLGVPKDSGEAAKWYGKVAADAADVAPRMSSSASKWEPALVAGEPDLETVGLLAMRAVELDAQIGQVRSLAEHPDVVVVWHGKKVTTDLAKSVVAEMEDLRQKLADEIKRRGSKNIAGAYDMRPADRKDCGALLDVEPYGRTPSEGTVSVTQDGSAVEFSGDDLVAGCGVVSGAIVVLRPQCSNAAARWLLGQVTDRGIEMAISSPPSRGCNLGTLVRGASGP